MEHHYMWSWPIYGYLFLAGLGAGAMVISNVVLWRGPTGAFGPRYFNIARLGALIGPLPVIIGTGLLIFELGRPFRSFNIMVSNFWFEVISPSPMNFGGWMLLPYSLFGILYALAFLPWTRLVPGPTGEALDRLSTRLRMPLSYIMAPLAIATAVYTGVLLGAMPSRPLWNSPILVALFTVSALSTGVAAIMLANRLSYRANGNREEDRHFHKSGFALTWTDMLLISLELLVIGMFFLYAQFTVADVRYAVRVLFPGGELGVPFWWGVVVFGLLLPLAVELYLIARRVREGVSFHAPYAVEVAVPLLILVGGFVLRYVIVIGGQMTGPIGI